MPGQEEILGAAKTARGQVNIIMVVIAFVMSCIVVNTYRACYRYNDKKKFSSDGMVKMSYVLSVIVIILSVFLFSYDIAIMAKIIK
jgi:heme/copper-type cytochrome/quinol oxidase subunit 2